MDLRKFKYYALDKGKIDSIRILDTSIEIKERNSDVVIQLYANDVNKFYFTTLEPYVNKPFYSIKSKKGTFILRSNAADNELYLKTLKFLGKNYLIEIQRRENRFNILFLLVLTSIGIVLLAIGIFKYLPIVYILLLFLSASQTVSDYKKFKLDIKNFEACEVGERIR